MMAQDFKIKNYTTSVPVEKTVMEIEKVLADFGATAVMKEYHGDGTLYRLVFRIRDRSYRLPANIDKVKERLRAMKLKRPVSNVDEQAPRVAWRVIKDWLHSQLSLIHIGLAEVDQILLPYMFDGKNTVYDLYKAGTLQIEDYRS